MYEVQHDIQVPHPPGSTMQDCRSLTCIIHLGPTKSVPSLLKQATDRKMGSGAGYSYTMVATSKHQLNGTALYPSRQEMPLSDHLVVDVRAGSRGVRRSPCWPVIAAAIAPDWMPGQTGRGSAASNRDFVQHGKEPPPFNRRRHLCLRQTHVPRPGNTSNNVSCPAAFPSMVVVVVVGGIQDL